MFRNGRFFYCALALLVLSSGCVRYIESRQEISKRLDLDPAKKRAGMLGFYRYEQEQRMRLDMLVKERNEISLSGTGTDYKIGPGDEIKLTVKNLEEVSKEYTVSSEGTIKIPFIGVVDLLGLSEAEASRMVSSLVTGFVVDPLVDVEVSKYASNVVWVLDNSSRGTTIDGARTANQNAFPLKRRDYTLMDLLLDLRNTSYFDSGIIHFYPAVGSNALSNPIERKDTADVKQSLMDRFDTFSTASWNPSKKVPKSCTGNEYDEGGKIRVKACYPYLNPVTEEEIRAKYEPGSKIEIDVEELFGGATKSPLKIILKAGDLVYIPPPPIIQLYGEVKAPGSFVAGSATGSGGGSGNVLKPTLLSSLSAARGLTYAADIGNVEIYREIHFGNKAILGLDLEKVVFLAGQDVKLRDGDIVLIPSKHGRFYEDTTIDGINSLAGSILNVDDASNVGSN